MVCDLQSSIKSGYFEDEVVLTIAHAARLVDRNRFFNARMGEKKWRAIDLFEGYELDESAPKALVREAVDCNTTP